MQFSALELANKINGQIEGNGEVTLVQPAKIEEGKQGTVSFIANMKYLPFLESTECSAVILSKDLNATAREGLTLIKVDEPYLAFASVLQMYSPKIDKSAGIHPRAVVEDSAQIGENVFIGANVYVGEDVIIEDNVQIGANSTVEDRSFIGANTRIKNGVHLYHDTKIGKDVIIHAGTVIGSDGFGFAQNDGVYGKVPQIGNVVVEDKVEIGSNCSIDRATLGSTIIKTGVKLDNLIQIAHNVVVGEHTVIAAQTGVSGSTKIGKNCMVGGQAGFAGHIEIADGTMVGAQAGMTKGTRKPGMYSGTPALPHGNSRKSFVLYKNLPDLYQKIGEIEKKLNDN